jgi:hydroxyacylglutathione hydrolase
MATLVHKISLGMVNCYLLRDGGMVLVDAGMPGYHNSFIKRMKQLGLSPQDIKLIIITHGHFDHYGSAKKLSELSGGLVAVHSIDAPILEAGQKVFPPPLNSWGKIALTTLKPLAGLMAIEPTEPDVTLEDGYSLKDFGINGRIVHTPGHTAGSISVFLDGGECLVGDLAMNGLPMRWGPGMPIFGDSADQIKRSWRRLLSMGARIIHPGHGASFPAKALEDAL